MADRRQRRQTATNGDNIERRAKCGLTMVRVSRWIMLWCLYRYEARVIE